MAAQATLFTPSLSTPKSAAVTIPWKQSSTLSFINSKPLIKPAASSRIVKVSAEAEAAATEAPAGFSPPELDPSTPSPIFAGSTGGTTPEGPGRGILCHNMGIPEGANLRNANGRRSHHATGPESAEIGEEGAVFGSGDKAEIQVQD
ncbi:Photosystem I reaction center subunit II, chloroplastic, partial [Cucurbita argyrosperma subsp. sororia]